MKQKIGKFWLFALCLCAALTLVGVGAGADADAHVMTVKFGDLQTQNYADFITGWNAAVGEGNTANTVVTLLADWTAGAAEKGTVTTSFGVGAGFGTTGSDNSNYGCILVPTSKTIILDLNGHTIDRRLYVVNGVYTPTADGYVIRVNGDLTVKDSGTAGTIQGGNNTSDGGGVYVNGSLTMKGGKITNNRSATHGGGVYAAGTMKVSGAPVISGNMVGANTGAFINNVYLPNSKIIENVNPYLSAGASIGVTPQTPPTDDVPVAIATGGAENTDYSGYFSDDTKSEGCSFYSEGETVKLGRFFEITKESSTGGSLYVMVQEKDVQRAVAGMEVLIVATPDAGYQLSALVVRNSITHAVTLVVNGEAFTMPGYPVQVVADFTAIPPPPPDTAVVSDEQGNEVSYADFGAALVAAKPGQTVTMLADVTFAGNLAVSNGVTLTLNEYALRCDRMIVETGATLRLGANAHVSIGSTPAKKAAAAESHFESLLLRGQWISKGEIALHAATLGGEGTTVIEAGRLILMGKSALGKIRLGAGVKVELSESFESGGETGSLYLGNGYEAGREIVAFAGEKNPGHFTLADAPDPYWILGADGRLAIRRVPGENALLREALVVGKGVKIKASNLLPYGYPSSTVTWESGDPSVLKLTGKGKDVSYQGAAPGETTLTAIFASGARVSVPAKVVAKKEAVSKVAGAKAVKLRIGENKTLSPKVTPGSAIDKTLVWISSDPAVAAVNGGEITAAGAGTCRVLAVSLSGARHAFKVTVGQYAKIAEYRLEPMVLTMKVGETATLRAEVSPETADGRVSWRSKSPKIAGVKGGVVTVKKPGVAKIVCEFANGKKLTCVVTVT